MIPITDLLVPILATGAAVFFASSIMHMLLPLHRSDYRSLPGEDHVLDALREQGVGPGTYMFPFCTSMDEMNSEGMKAKFDRGPVGWMTVLTPGGFSMGRSLGRWICMAIVVSAVCGYVASFTLPADADGELVFRLIGTLTFLAYATGSFSEWIWKGLALSTALKFTIDAAIYSLVSGAVFAWLWPA
jgi:hypothetical protein